MPSIHENELGVKAGGYKDARGNQTPTEPSTIYASQIIESPLRRFITDAERYAIAQLQKNGMLKDTYDADNDGMIDRANMAERANKATVADKALLADNAIHANTADRAAEADKANRATIADKATDASHAENADTATNAVHANTADKATEARTADRASLADMATEAEAVAWDKVTSKPVDLAKLDDITWDKVKASAPDILSDAATLENRMRNLDSLSHTHANKESLDKIGQGLDGKPTWNGSDWPGAKGDMLKSIYDTDGDGVVDKAKTVAWDDISGKPARFPAEPHNINANNVDLDPMHRFVTDAQIDSWTAKQAPIGYTPEDASKKGVPNGYAGLDSDGKIPESQIRGLQWEALGNKPTSAVADIDDAVTKRHSHTNLTTLDKIGENGSNQPTWGGVEWPYAGDMKLETFDADSDGIIDKAKSADSVLWSGITGKPTSTVANIDDAVNRKHTHANIDALALLDKNSLDEPLWKNNPWPYDMKKSVYDTDSDGVVDEAERARAVQWSGVIGKPTSPIDKIDEAVANSHTHANIETLDVLGKNVDESRLTFKGKEIAYKEDVPAVQVPGGVIQGKNSVTIDTNDNKITLVNDDVFPGANKYYGTNESEVRGFFSIPNPKPLTGTNSVVVDTNGLISLKNDNPAPLANYYYGTDSNRTLGYFPLPTGGSNPPVLTEIDPSIIKQDDNHRFVTKSLLEKLTNLPAGGSGGSGGGSGGTPPTPQINPDTIDGVVLGSTRQCIISAANGFFNLNGSDLIIRASETSPLIASFSGGRFKETIKKIKSNLTVLNVPSVIDAGTAYIMLVLDGDNVTATKTGIKPIYSDDMPTDKTDGQYWFDTSNYTMYLANGTTYVQAPKPVLFIGQIDSKAGIVTSTTYAINGIYDSGWFTVARNVTYNKNHNMGTDSVTVTAYRGHNNVNMGHFQFGYIYSSLSPNTVENFGDAVIKITDLSVQTKRFCWADNLVEGTSQHRVIVKRAW